MRLSRTVLGGAFLAAIALSACTTPGNVSRSEENRKMIDAEFGTVGPRSNPEAFRENGKDGNGFAMFRLYSEKPMPNNFGTIVPERFDNTLVVDFGVDMDVEGEFPLYRIGMDPTKISRRRIDLWPGYVLLEGPGDTGGKLAARLPKGRVPGPDGMIWSDWTYCADCFDLDKIRDADTDTAQEAFEAIGQAYAAAEARNGTESPYAGHARFTITPGVGVLSGEPARDMAQTASVVVASSQARIAAMRPARDAYEAMRRDFQASASPDKEVERLCGTYEPNRDTIDIKTEEIRIEAYLDCSAAAIESFDAAQREDEVASFRVYEQELAQKAGLKEAQRISFQSVDQEISDAQDVMEDAYARFVEFAKAVKAPEARAVKADVPAPVSAIVAAPVPAPAPVPVPVPVPVEKVLVTDEDQALMDAAEKAIEASSAVAPVSEEVSQAGPPAQDVYYVARLLSDGANMNIGQQKTGCIGDLVCETGSIVSLIAVSGYCEAEGEITKTSSGWGMLVQRYRPQDSAEEKLIVAGDGLSKVHVVTDNDETAMKEGLDAVRALTMKEDPVFFASYEDFYGVNAEEKGCKDIWRDSARNRVIQNPEIVFEK
jgi:hypothetical protein